MDHMVQIPQVGRRWEDLPESWTTLAWLAARTRTIRLGTLVTGVTLRNPAHLAKIVATLDVLSGGRAICGLGLAWWEWEHQLYGWPFPATADRYALLEDTLQLLPVMWGPGSPPFAGRTLKVAETICYPRPVQEHVPHPGRRIRAHRPRSGWPPATPTPAICSATRRRWPANGHPGAPLRRRRPGPGGGTGDPPVQRGGRRLAAGGGRRHRSPAAARACRRNRLRTGGAREPSTTRSGAIAGWRKRASRRPLSPCPTLFTPGALEAFGEVIAGFDAPPPSVPW